MRTITRKERFIEGAIKGSPPDKAITRFETYFAKLAGEDVVVPTPVTSTEFYLAYLCGEDVTLPEPVTRIDYYLAQKCGLDVTVPVPIRRIERLIAEWDPSGSEEPQAPTDAIVFYSTEPFSIKTGQETKNWDGALYWSTDKSNWSEWTGSSATSGLNEGWNTIYLRGSGNTYVSNKTTGNGTRSAIWPISSVSADTEIVCKGNLMNLLDPINPVMDEYAFATLFYQANANSQNIRFEVTLPATTLTKGCYQRMFQGRTSLTTAPALPALQLAEDCYYNMFTQTSLTIAPELPATELSKGCYRYMFYACVSLVTAPELPATVLADSCYHSMFTGCSSLVKAPQLPALNMASNCYNSMFQSCTSLVDVPELPATTTSANCYDKMFRSCTSLESLPELSSMDVNASSYDSMFRGCSRIKISTTRTDEYTTPYRIPSVGTGTTVGVLLQMFSDTGGTFTGYPEINTTYYTANRVVYNLPSGYKRLVGLELNKARFVLTGFFLTGDDTLRFRAKGSASNWIGSFTSASATDNYSFYATSAASGKYARYNGQTGGSSVDTNEWYDVVMSPTGVEGTNNPSAFTPSTFTCSVPLCIGATSPTGAAGNVSFEGNIYVDGRLRLIPCERESDGELGWHDGTNFWTASEGTVESLGYADD